MLHGLRLHIREERARVVLSRDERVTSWWGRGFYTADGLLVSLRMGMVWH